MSYVDELKDKSVEELEQSLSEAKTWLNDFILDAWFDGDGRISTSNEYIIDNASRTIFEIERELISRGVAVKRWGGDGSMVET